MIICVIDRKVKRRVAKMVKEELNKSDYVELYIVYNLTKEQFEIINNESVCSRLVYEGEYEIYSTFTHTNADGKLTLTEIENMIFK